ncbi:MAG: 2Fe-2S iron-sulfur cluster-binding protein, partial [Dehalococcoidia bacterium]
MSNFRVTFQPSGKSVSVPQGTLILDAAARAGVLIDTPCGGQGRCGRCLVRVEEGEASHRENPHLTAQQMQEGWVLSCTARVAGDLRLAVPRRRERERVVAETAAARTAQPVECDWPRSPTIRQVFVELTPPTLDDTATDLERLRAAQAAEHPIDSQRVELPRMRRLA